MNRKYSCIIVDDEPDATGLLSELILKNCPELQIVAIANCLENALKAIQETLPELIFMDIKLGDDNEFEVIREILKSEHKPYVIFVTASNQFAMEAFHANAIDYILKPADPNELKNAVHKFVNLCENEKLHEQITQLLCQFPKKIRFNTRAGFVLMHLKEIIWCEANRSYTKIFVATDDFKLISHNLAFVEEKLHSAKFWRISRSHLVNSDFVESVDRKKKQCVLKLDSKEVVLSGSSDYLKKL